MYVRILLRGFSFIPFFSLTGIVTKFTAHSIFPLPLHWGSSHFSVAIISVYLREKLELILFFENNFHIFKLLAIDHSLLLLLF
jgi:ABC-type spermidine/putrescine transport system permease subunit I